MTYIQDKITTTVFAPHRGNVITLQTRQSPINKYAEDTKFNQAYWLEMTHLVSSAMDDNAYNPAESTSLTIGLSDLDKLIEMLQEHRVRMLTGEG